MLTSYKKAHGLLVVSLQEGASLGRMDDFQFDLESWVIYGYRIKGSGMFGKAGGVAAERLDRIGRDVAFIQAEADVEWSASRNAEAGRAWASQYRGTRVIGRNGVSLGQVEDFVFEAGRGIRGLILDGDRRVELDERVRTGPAAIVIADPELVADITPPEGEAEPEDNWWSWLTRPSKGDKKAARDKAPEPADERGDAEPS